MSPTENAKPCPHRDDVGAYALGSLPAAERRTLEGHISGCVECQSELRGFRPLAAAFAVALPEDRLRPARSIEERLAQRISGRAAMREGPASDWIEPEWDEVSPGIFCKLLANDAERHRVSMLVRLLPNVEYPPHTHAEFEELHLLEGELWIDDRKLYPGDFNRADTPTSDRRVWTETGCTCVLVTSTRDILG